VPKDAAGLLRFPALALPAEQRRLLQHIGAADRPREDADVRQARRELDAHLDREAEAPAVMAGALKVMAETLKTLKALETSRSPTQGQAETAEAQPSPPLKPASKRGFAALLVARPPLPGENHTVWARRAAPGQVKHARNWLSQNPGLWREAGGAPVRPRGRG
jgi:hypothetical protein